MEIKMLKRKKSWEPFRICLLNSTANSANFHPNWSGLAVLFNRQILNGSQDFFLFNILILIYFSKYDKMKRDLCPCIFLTFYFSRMYRELGIEFRAGFIIGDMQCVNLIF